MPKDFCLSTSVPNFFSSFFVSVLGDIGTFYSSFYPVKRRVMPVGVDCDVCLLLTAISLSDSHCLASCD
jgi:hypothetical protein